LKEDLNSADDCRKNTHALLLATDSLPLLLLLTTLGGFSARARWIFDMMAAVERNVHRGFKIWVHRLRKTFFSFTVLLLRK